MNKVSRRALAHWAAAELTSGKPAGSVARHMAAILKQQGMVNQVDFLIGDIEWELEQQGSLVFGVVTSARPISKQLESALKSQLKKVSKAGDVALENVVDKEVLGGLRVETSRHVWDQTIARKLSELREVF